MAEMMECPLCGGEIQAGAKRCRWCREYLDGAEPETADENERPRKKGKKKRRGAAADADVLWRGHPSLWGYLRLYGIALFLLVLGIALAFWQAWCLILLLPALGLIGYGELDRRTRVYTVTPERVEVRLGIIARTTHEVGVHDIRAINLKQGVVERLLGLGTIEIGSAGTDEIEVVFSSVPRAAEIRDLIRQARG